MGVWVFRFPSQLCQGRMMRRFYVKLFSVAFATGLLLVNTPGVEAKPESGAPSPLTVKSKTGETGGGQRVSPKLPGLSRLDREKARRMQMWWHQAPIIKAIELTEKQIEKLDALLDARKEGKKERGETRRKAHEELLEALRTGKFKEAEKAARKLGDWAREREMRRAQNRIALFKVLSKKQLQILGKDYPDVFKRDRVRMRPGKQVRPGKGAGLQPERLIEDAKAAAKAAKEAAKAAKEAAKGAKGVEKKKD